MELSLQPFSTQLALPSSFKMPLDSAQKFRPGVQLSPLLAPLGSREKEKNEGGNMRESDPWENL